VYEVSELTKGAVNVGETAFGFDSVIPCAVPQIKLKESP
jgi:hypothetical protein